MNIGELNEAEDHLQQVEGHSLTVVSFLPVRPDPGAGLGVRKSLIAVTKVQRQQMLLFEYKVASVSSSFTAYMFVFECQPFQKCRSEPCELNWGYALTFS